MNLPQLQQEWNISTTQCSFITTSVQLGFIFGAVVSTVLGLTDKFNPRKLFIISSIAGAMENILLVFCSSFWAGLILRFLTGISMAGVYPIAVKMISLWFKDKKGLSIGILIAGLTLGSSPLFLSLFKALTPMEE